MEVPKTAIVPNHSGEDDVLTRAQALLGCHATAALWRGGRNSRVYRVETDAGTFALKLYPDDGRDRAQREFDAATFFVRSGVTRVPRPVAIDETRRSAIFSWIDGQTISDVTQRDIGSLADFAAELHDLRAKPAALALPDAVEACFDEQSVLDQIELRFARLADVRDELMLREFLLEHFAPVLNAERARVRAGARQRNRIASTLSPSDFGFHNALRTSSRTIAFLDFEYFGWDDPVKLTADVCWHPGMALSTELQGQFIQRCIDIYRDDPWFEQRLRCAFALYGMRWCLIVLNEFLPAFWERRIAAGVALPAAGVQAIQLGKAYALLNRVAAGLRYR